MEVALPTDVRHEIRAAHDCAGAPARRRTPAIVAVSGAAGPGAGASRAGLGARRHAVVELTAAGMVIRAEDMPHLRGFVDILRGDERLARHLVVFSWARDGLAGYEFKRGGSAGAAPADHERPAHAGLIGGPDRIAPGQG